MKQILIILLVLISAQGMAQNTGGTITPTTKFQQLNKSAIASGQRSLDGKYKYTDTVNFKERAFINLADAKYYVPTNQRTMGLTVFVNNGGTLVNGTITGGTNDEYWWRNGIAEGDLILKGGSSAEIAFTDSSKMRGTTRVIVWGNSLGYGTGGTPTTEYTGGVPFAEYLKNMSGYDVVTQAVPGETSTQITARFIANPSLWYNGHIIEMGTNDGPDSSTVMPNVRKIKKVLDSIGNTRYIFMGIAGWSHPSYWSGTANHTGLTIINNAISNTVGVLHYADTKAALVAAYNPALSQDVIDFGHNIPATSLMYPGDAVHYNDLGYMVWATVANTKMGIMKPTTEQRTVGTGSLLDMFRYAPVIRTPLTVSKQVAVNLANPSTTVLTDGNGRSDMLYAQINGGVSILNNSATGAEIGGWHIRNGLKNLGGKAIMSLMGTNPSVWTSYSQGFFPTNHVRGFEMGSDFKQTGTFNNIGNIITSGGASVGGILNAGSYTNAPFFTPRRVIDVSSSIGGIVIPDLNQTQMDAVGGGSPFGGGKPLIAEIAFNRTLDRFQGGRMKNSPYEAWSTFLFREDVDGAETKIQNGAGVGIAGLGTTASPYVVTNTTLPPATKLTGYWLDGYFQTPAPNDTSKAHDGDIATIYRSATNDVDPNPYLITNFPAANVITQVRVYPSPGQTLLGTKILGWDGTTLDELLTLPDVPFYQWSQFSISTTKVYQQVRLSNASSVYQLAVAELEYYGYVPVPPIALTTTGTGAATLINGVLNIPSAGVGGSTDTTSLSTRINTKVNISDTAGMLNNYTTLLESRAGQSPTAPITYNTTTGAIGITQATTSANGYLSSTDWNAFNGKQAALVSGTNIKTINSTSILGSGNIVIAGGTIDATIIDGSTNAPTGNAVFDALVLKANQQALIDSMAAMRARDTASTLFDQVHFSNSGGVLQLRYPVSRDTFIVSRLVGRSASVGYSITSGAGTAPTVSLNATSPSTDLAGTIVITTGASGTFTGGLNSLVSFAGPAYSTPPHVTIGAASGPAAALQLYAQSGTTGFFIYSNNNLAASTTYKISYIIAQ